MKAEPGEWNERVLCADDTPFIGEPREGLQPTVFESERACNRRNTSKISVVRKYQRGDGYREGKVNGIG